MIGADTGRFLLVAMVPAAVWADFARMELLYGLTFLTGVLTVLYQLADFALLPRVVDGDQLVDGNGAGTVKNCAPCDEMHGCPATTLR